MPILIATFCSTLAGIVGVAVMQKINLFNKTVMLYIGGATAAIAALLYALSGMDSERIEKISSVGANVILFGIIMTFITTAAFRRINVYDAFIEGAKDGFATAVKIIPFLVAILVGIGVFRASGAMDCVVGGISWLVALCGLDTSFVEALPTAFMKPLSGSGARGMMIEAMNNFGADSFVGRLSCMFQGAADTTFYILAVYFGSVGIRKTRHAVGCGLLADVAGVVAAIAVGYLFFN